MPAKVFQVHSQNWDDSMVHVHCMLDTRLLRLIAFPLQQWMHEHVSMLHYT